MLRLPSIIQRNLPRVAVASIVAVLCIGLLQPALLPTRATTAFAGKGKPAPKKSAPKKSASKKSEPRKTVAKASGTKRAGSKAAAATKKGSAKKTLARKGAESKASSKTLAKRSAGRGAKERSTRAERSARPARERTVARITPRPLPTPVNEQIIADTSYVEDLADGISHRWIRTRTKQVANVVTIDLTTGARLRSFKAMERYDGLRNARDIGIDAFQRLGDTVIAATNASFWRAGSNSPIGPTIAGGEVLEMPGYKAWSSLLIFTDGTAAIDRITLEGELFWRDRHFQIGAVNRRGNTQGIVVYNHHYGDSVPMGSRKSDSAIVSDAFANRVLSESGDDTEANGIDTATVIRSYRESKLLEDREHPMLKIACTPVRPKRKRDLPAGPLVGDTMRLVVTEIDTGAVAVPENGYVLSLGVQQEWFSVVKAGDTVRLVYTITPRQPKPIRDVLTGTPRLVRDGMADPEYETEGSKARRFVDGRLARTAIGITRGGDTLILATVNSGCTCTETTGMSLAQLAAFMQSLGSYQALNFDGGGSASMAINGAMISRQGSGPSSRRVSNALLAVRPLKPKRAAAKRAVASEGALNE